MAILTTAQKDFLEHQNIPLSRVFDATRMRTADYKRVMAELGMVVAIGVAPCQAAGHTLRTRAGHCALCHPSNLGFLLRYDDPGEVYVARSMRGSLTKVGTAKNSVERVRNLNGYGYGGVSDWQVKFSQQCQKAGRVEGEAHRILSAYSVSSRTYFKDGGEIVCQEIFSCDVVVAMDAIRKALASVSGIEGNSLKDSAGSKSNKPQQSPPLISSVDIPIEKKIFVRRDPSPAKSVTQSVKVFAGELGLPPTLLLEQLNLAGVYKQSSEGKVTEHDKTVLLEYLRSKHKSPIISPPITLASKNKSIHDRANAEKITQELNALDELRNYYFSMSLEQLMALWIDSKDKLEEEDAQMIKIAIRNKSGIAK